MTILVTGVLTTIYTTVGGMKAVIRTDVMQFVVLIGGQFAILVAAIRKIPGGFAGAFQLADQAGKFKLDWSLDPTVRITFWGVIIGSRLPEPGAVGDRPGGGPAVHDHHESEGRPAVAVA